MPEPNFFGVGAAKSGTTAVWRFLSQHPDVAMPLTFLSKESSYFAQSASFAVRTKHEYLALFSHGVRAKARGEMCNTYLTSPESPEKIKDSYPNAKIFMILRDPASRALSLYIFMVSEGLEHVRSFEEALAVEEVRRGDVKFQKQNPMGFAPNYEYFNSGLYSTQVQRYLNTFAADQIKIWLYDDFAENPKGFMRDLYSFLEVDPSFEPTLSRHNKSKWPASITAHYMMRQHFEKIAPAGKTLLGKIIRSPMSRTRKTLQNANLMLGTIVGVPKHPELVNELRRHYAEDRERLAELIGRDLSAWQPR